jgi:hypothetical protein
MEIFRDHCGDAVFKPLLLPVGKWQVIGVGAYAKFTLLTEGGDRT